MSNYDAGHYFLTVFAPIRQGQQTDRHMDSSHVTALRLDLWLLPTAEQDEASLGATVQSAFASVPGIHFARFFILDQLVYNGRRPTNAVVNLLAAANPVRPEPVDQFENAWLVMTLDMDAPDSDLASILKALHVQERFGRFAMAEQGTDAASLHRAFGDFIAAQRPTDRTGPTQAAGRLPANVAR